MACGVDEGSAAGAVARTGAGGGWMLGSTDRAYRGQAMFNSVLLAARARTCRGWEWRRRDEISRHAFLHGRIAGERPRVDGRSTDGRDLRLMGRYARHPASTFGFLWETLVEGAGMRLANLRTFAGGRQAPGAPHRFARGACGVRHCDAGRHIVLWYAVRRRVPGERVAWRVGLGVAVLGGEFGAVARRLPGCGGTRSVSRGYGFDGLLRGRGDSRQCATDLAPKAATRASRAMRRALRMCLATMRWRATQRVKADRFADAAWRVRRRRESGTADRDVR